MRPLIAAFVLLLASLSAKADTFQAASFAGVVVSSAAPSQMDATKLYGRTTLTISVPVGRPSIWVGYSSSVSSQTASALLGREVVAGQTVELAVSGEVSVYALNVAGSSQTVSVSQFSPVISGR